MTPKARHSQGPSDLFSAIYDDGAELWDTVEVEGVSLAESQVLSPGSGACASTIGKGACPWLAWWGLVRAGFRDAANGNDSAGVWIRGFA